MEERLLTFELANKVSMELEESGFEHVVARVRIDPGWRRECRPHWPESAQVCWTICVTDFLLPLPQIKKLTEICERNSLTVWWGASDPDEEGGRTLYLKCGTSSAVHRM